MSNLQLAVQFFVQIAVILVVCQIVGLGARRVGQPQAMAEMVAGILLGPSLLGLVWPALFDRIFPPETMRVIFAISQLGLAAYMFVVGLEFQVSVIRDHLRSALAVSVAGMIAPFVLGGALGWHLHGNTTFLPARTTPMEAMLFMGASMCITAFPMLARIIQFKNLGGTSMGTVSLGAGALNDVAAWCLLAFVLASLDDDFTQAAFTIGGGVAYVAVAFLVIRPLLAQWGRRIEARGFLSDGAFVGCVALMAMCAACTEAIGLHAVFGAFVLGAIMPRGAMTTALIERIQPLTVALLLPLFFTYSGLNTQMGLLDSAYLWGMAALILAAAIVGKGMACWAAARVTGVPNREALGIGVLMNVRGLMELIIINIGLQRGIITPALFAALVIMAVVTTLMASPLFEWLVARRKTNDAVRLV